jgi:diguanylate cyclase
LTSSTITGRESPEERAGLRLLAVEDNPADAVLVREMLRDTAWGGALELVHVPSVEAAVDRLLDGAFDCVLLDLSLPDAEGLEGLAQVRTVALDVPVVVFSGRVDEDVAMRAVQEGAQDCLIKGQVDARLLARSLSYAIERKRAEVELTHQALHDALTDLPNRALFYDRLGQALARLDRHDGALAVLFCDLDRFKVVNDSLGHGAGDRLLVAVARRLLSALRAGDTAARFGGDEFVVLCEDVEGELQAIAVAERIAAALQEPFRLGEGMEVHVRTSIGIALATDSGARAEALIRDADAAMYRAKERGRAGYEVFDDEMRDRAVRRLETETSLHRALERGELTLCYQPQVRLATGDLVGVEALVRWSHPERGPISPADFVALAEETGLIVPIGAWILEAACRQAALWAAEWPRAARVRMAINLSARQCASAEIVATVAGAIERTGVDPGRICLEITETAMTEALESKAAVLRSLKELGIALAIDDFGTGHSSLRALRRLPVDQVKIDASFVAGMGQSDQEAAIVSAVIGLAHALELETIAEGVETIAQVDRLRALGCDVAQGFYFSEPLRPEELGAMLAAE